MSAFLIKKKNAENNITVNRNETIFFELNLKILMNLAINPTKNIPKHNPKIPKFRYVAPKIVKGVPTIALKAGL